MQNSRRTPRSRLNLNQNANSSPPTTSKASSRAGNSKSELNPLLQGTPATRIICLVEVAVYLILSVANVVCQSIILAYLKSENSWDGGVRTNFMLGLCSLFVLALIVGVSRKTIIAAASNLPLVVVMVLWTLGMVAMAAQAINEGKADLSQFETFFGGLPAWYFVIPTQALAWLGGLIDMARSSAEIDN